MSYGVSAALQSAIYDRLSTDPRLSALVGGAIYDAPPSGRLPPLWVSLGAEEVRPRSDASGQGAEHRLVISVVGEAAGFAQAKVAAGAIGDALVAGGLVLSRGRLVSLRFLRAKAHQSGTGRRIDLTYRARTEDRSANEVEDHVEEVS